MNRYRRETLPRGTDKKYWSSNIHDLITTYLPPSGTINKCVIGKRGRKNHCLRVKMESIVTRVDLLQSRRERWLPPFLLFDFDKPPWTSFRGILPRTQEKRKGEKKDERRILDCTTNPEGVGRIWYYVGTPTCGTWFLPSRLSVRDLTGGSKEKCYLF